MITAFLPCRLGSQRVPRKNTKPFAGIEGGLLSIKLNQLLRSKLIDKIVLSSNDPEVFETCVKVSNEIILDERPNHLALASTSTDELINYIPNIISQGHVLWTHTTSPFLGSQTYDKAILTYKELLANGAYDSLMSTNKVQTFLWDNSGSLNYNRTQEKWPRTQTLMPVHEVNSGIFLNSIENFRKYQDRIGEKPYFFNLEGFESFDIDWEDDFILGELIQQQFLGQL